MKRVLKVRQTQVQTSGLPLPCWLSLDTNSSDFCFHWAFSSWLRERPSWPYLLLLYSFSPDRYTVPLQHSTLTVTRKNLYYYHYLHAYSRKDSFPNMSTCFLELSFSLISPINSREEPCPSELTCEQRSLADYSPWGHKESDMTEHACIHTHTLITTGLWPIGLIIHNGPSLETLLPT